MSFFHPLLSSTAGPRYDLLTGVTFHNRTEGLATNTDNGFGTVDVSGNVTVIKSCPPHANGRTMGSQGTAPTLTGGYVTIGAAGNFRDPGATSVWNDYHYKAASADIEWSIHGVFNFPNTNSLFGLFGNNGSSSASKGICGYLDDRTSNPSNKVLFGQITKGVSQSFISHIQAYNIIPFGQDIDFWLQVKKSDTQGQEVTLRINKKIVITWNRQDTSSAVTTPTYAMEFGAVGNAVLRGGFLYKEITFQTGVHTDAFVEDFINARMAKYHITSLPGTYESFLNNGEPTIVETIDDGKYHLTTHLCQKPSDPDVIIAITDEGEGHVSLTNRRIVKRTSTDRGVTFSAKSVLHSDGTNFPIDASAGYDSNDRLWLVWASALVAGGVNKLWYAYSDDDGATLSTPVEITSILPADGLTVFRTYCTVIENSGRIMVAMYKQNSGAFSSAATYLVYSDDNGATWGYKTIRAATGTYRNECDIVHLTGTTLLIIQRNEASFEWDQYISTNNGDTWTAQGAITFGETIDVAGPVRLCKTQINGTDMIACAYPDRERDVTKVIWGKVSSIVASGIAGWNYSAKHVVFQGSGYDGSEGHLHYNGLCYPNNDFEGLSMGAVDLYPSVGGVTNKLVTMRFPTYSYPFIKTLLGL